MPRHKQTHQKLKHMMESIIQQTAKFHNWMITNQFDNFASCALAKSGKRIPIKRRCLAAICLEKEFLWTSVWSKTRA